MPQTISYRPRAATRQAHRTGPIAPEPHWQPSATPADMRTWPTIVLVERQPVLSATLAELFEALCLRMVRVATGPELAAALDGDRPIGVLAYMPVNEAPPAGLAALLDLVAQTDATLPVMAITDPPADAVRAAGDSGARPLVNLVWLPRLPGLRMVMEFLCLAERRRALPGLMPA